MPATLTFTQFTDTRLIFANREAANAFFGAITVAEAGASSAGVISQKAANVTFTYVAPSDTHVIMPLMQADGSMVTKNLCSFEQFELLRAQLEGLNTAFQAALTALKTAGVMSNT
jgi:hypothetical protein